MRTLWLWIPFKMCVTMCFCMCRRKKMVLCSNCFAHKNMPLQNVIKQSEMYILFTDMHSFLTGSRSGAELLYWQLQVSLCGWVHAYLFVCVYFSGILSFSSANWITLLRAKSLATEIKRLCFVVMVRKILFKSRLPSKKQTKRGRKRKEEEEAQPEDSISAFIDHN